MPLAPSRRQGTVQRSSPTMARVLSLADLAHLPRPGSGKDDREFFHSECKRLGLEWPPSVIDQLLFEHGDKDEFLEQYGHLNLLRLRWELRSVRASELIPCTSHEEFSDRVRSVAKHPHWTLEQYSKAYGRIRDHSWKVAPLLIEGRLREPPQIELHLVEGHTRIGVLMGLVQLGEVPADSEHDAFVAAS
jgi:hypothetical protein